MRVHRRKWWPFQPSRYVMAPDGDLWFHPAGPHWCEDFTDADPGLQGLFVHEMTHVWQAQRGGRWFLPMVRHPFCRYDYSLVSGKPFTRYGIEQQAEIVRVAWVAQGHGKQNEERAILPFGSRFGPREA